MEGLLFQDHLYTIYVYDQSIIVEDVNTHRQTELVHSSNLRFRQLLAETISGHFDFVPFKQSFEKSVDNVLFSHLCKKQQKEVQCPF